MRKGRSKTFRGYRPQAARILRFGDVQYTSDAAVITCWSRRIGVTCKHYLGLSFTLGRGGGHRIFHAPPGLPPNVETLFRTGRGLYCGIDADNLEPAKPLLRCWRPLDGLDLVIAHGRGVGHSRREMAVNFRPSGFRTLGFGESVEWRCREVSR